MAKIKPKISRKAKAAKNYTGSQDVQIRLPDGSIGTINTASPLYAQMYDANQIQSTPGTEAEPINLQEVTVRPPKGFWEQSYDKFQQDNKDSEFIGAMLSPFTYALSVPQQAMMYGATGKVQDPSEALGIENPYAAFAANAILDPANIIGAGLASKGRALPFLNNLVNPLAGVNLKSHLSKALKGTGHVLDQAVGELLRGKANKKAIKEGNEWLENWIRNPATREKIDRDIDKKISFLSSNDPYENYEILEDIRTQAKTFKPDSKEYSLLKQLDQNLQQYLSINASENIHKGNLGVSYMHQYPSEHRKFVDMGFVTPDDFYGSWISRSPSMSQYRRKSTTIHEGVHDWVSDETLKKTGMRNISLKNTNPEIKKDFLKWEEYRKKGLDPEKHMGKEKAFQAYLAAPTEMHARIMQLRKAMNTTPDVEITPEVSEKVIEWIKSGKSPVPIQFLNVIDENPKKLSELFNKFWAVTPAVGLAGAAAIQEKKNGGSVSDWEIIDNDLPIMQGGGKGTRPPIYVDNPNDPRLRAYQDSLYSYNITKKYEGKFPVVSNEIADKITGLKTTPDPMGHMPIGWYEKPSDNPTLPFPTFSPKYKKPVQPVEFKAAPPDTLFLPQYSKMVQGKRMPITEEEYKSKNNLQTINKQKLQAPPGKVIKIKQSGGDIPVDPMGYWNPDNYDEPAVTIPSNEITMQGIDYPIYGEDNTGYAQMMYPGEDYIFPGDYVTEYPLPEAGGGYRVIRSNERKGKTHKVIGPDGTVKFFGDSKLGQHPKDPARKKAFYARHKKNLAKNPYFRAFARKTWAEGGMLPDLAAMTFGGLQTMQTGGTRPHIAISDPIEFARRAQDYEDSLDLYRVNEAIYKNALKANNTVTHSGVFGNYTIQPYRRENVYLNYPNTPNDSEYYADITDYSPYGRNIDINRFLPRGANFLTDRFRERSIANTGINFNLPGDIDEVMRGMVFRFTEPVQPVMYQPLNQSTQNPNFSRTIQQTNQLYRNLEPLRKKDNIKSFNTLHTSLDEFKPTMTSSRLEVPTFKSTPIRKGGDAYWEMKEENGKFYQRPVNINSSDLSRKYGETWSPITKQTYNLQKKREVEGLVPQRQGFNPATQAVENYEPSAKLARQEFGGLPKAQDGNLLDLYYSKENQKEKIFPQKQWLENWINHPEFQKRLANNLREINQKKFFLHQDIPYSFPFTYGSDYWKQKANEEKEKGLKNLKSVKEFYAEGYEPNINLAVKYAKGMYPENKEQAKNQALKLLYGSKGQFSPSDKSLFINSEYANKSTPVHEYTHSTYLDHLLKPLIPQAKKVTEEYKRLEKLNPGFKITYDIYGNPILSNHDSKGFFDKTKYIDDKSLEKQMTIPIEDIKYLNKSEEIYPRIMQLRYENYIKPGQIIDKKSFQKIKKTSGSNSIFDLYNDEEIIDLMNKLAKNKETENINKAAFGGNLILEKYQGGGSKRKNKKQTIAETPTVDMYGRPIESRVITKPDLERSYYDPRRDAIFMQKDYNQLDPYDK